MPYSCHAQYRPHAPSTFPLIRPQNPRANSLSRYNFGYDNYTSLWNMLDYCATTMPVTRVSDDDVQHQGIVEKHGSDYEKNGKSVNSAFEDKRLIRSGGSESLLGCPVGVQLVGRRLGEEYLLGVTKACHEALRANEAHGIE